MSMSRSVLEELCDYVTHKPSVVLGNKFFDCRAALCTDISYKSEKFETKLLVISKFRVFVVTGKSPSSLKVEKSFHILSVRSIHAVAENEISITVDDSHSKKPINIRSSQTSKQLSLLFLSSLKRYFPDIGNQLKNHIQLKPSALYEEFQSIPSDASARPCHSFRRTYAALCDFYDQPYREEVSWDIDKIYTINNIKVLRIEDFSHLLPRDLIPIVAVLMYSTYFTGLEADGIRVPNDLVDIILTVVMKSSSLVHLQLRNCGLPRDFILLLANAIQHASVLPLETLDLSKNVLDDKKGFSHLCTVLHKLTSLRRLILAECSLSDKCVQLLCSGIYNGLTSSKPSASHGLVELNLAYSTIKDDVSPLVNLVSLCTPLRVLDLTDTMFPLDKLWPALKFGGLQMEKLLLGGCSAGKKSADSAHIMKEFFSMAVGLQHISFSNTLLNPELLKAILLGLASNEQLKPYSLDLDGVCEKGCGPVLEGCLGALKCSSLSLRDNNLETDLHGVLKALLTIPTLTRLDLGGMNFTQLRRSSKPTHSTVLNRILSDIVKLCSDDCPLEELILSKAQLSSHLSLILNTLGATSTLRVLDISNNELTNFGARILSKALQLNVSLRTLIIDGNRIGSEGFVDIASAMQMNYTLTAIPYPVNDVFDCKARNEHARALASLATIETALERNRSVDSIELANAKRGLTAGIQNLLDLGLAAGDSVSEIFHEPQHEPPLPPKVENMVQDFVEQLRREASSFIQETAAKIGNLPPEALIDATKAEKIAADRLKELWMKDVKVVISDWRWRELVERSEQALRVQGGSRTESSSNASFDTSVDLSSPGGIRKRSSESTPAGRPRSIIGETAGRGVADEVESGISLDSPPKVSNLVHLQKSRPKRRGRGDSVENEISMMNRSCDVLEQDEDSQSLADSEDSRRSEPKKPLSERVGFRPAMLPEAAMLGSVHLNPISDRVQSPREPISPLNTSPSDESPPPLPYRARATPSSQASPPILPPKPEPKMRSILPPSSEDEQNANNARLSVADMTRIFNR